jgi:hypothetical protein
MKNTENIGLWYWVYNQVIPPAVEGINLKIQYNGFADIKKALSQDFPEQSDFDSLSGDKYLEIGGGPSDYFPGCSTFTSAVLQQNTADILSGVLSGYDGIAFDIELGDSGLEQDFQDCFNAAKKMGLKVIVSVSFSSPYAVDDSETLMESFLNSTNIDFLSPQLYQSGDEGYPVFTAGATPWSSWAKTTIPIIPSIAYAAYYPAVQKWFSGICETPLAGFIQWKNKVEPPPGPTPTPSDFKAVVTIVNNTDWDCNIDNISTSGTAKAGGSTYKWITTVANTTTLQFMGDGTYQMSGSLDFGPTSGIGIDRGDLTNDGTIQCTTIVTGLTNTTPTTRTWVQTENGPAGTEPGPNYTWCKWNEFQDGGTIVMTFDKI